MPLYDLTCRQCDMDSEHLMGMNDNHVHIKCPGCGAKMTIHENKKYDGMKIQIQGDTVSGGCSYDYYDEHLDCHIRSKKHRAEEMKKQGVTEYAPDPEFKKHRDNERYIKRNSRPGDNEAANAIHKERATAIEKRQKRSIDRAFDKVPMPTLPEM